MFMRTELYYMYIKYLEQCTIRQLTIEVYWYRYYKVSLAFFTKQYEMYLKIIGMNALLLNRAILQGFPLN